MAQEFDGPVTIKNGDLRVTGRIISNDATGGGGDMFTGTLQAGGNITCFELFAGSVKCINGGLTCKDNIVIGQGDLEVRAGNVKVSGDVQLTNADCAEDFTIAPGLNVGPGTVVVLGPEGSLLPCEAAYDKRVVGVVSGAGDYQPGIVLDRKPSEDNRQPVALIGKIYCNVDADSGAIEIGDLLTTSPTPGHAMKAADPVRAFGAVLGKALRPLSEGRGLIPVLVTLQ